MLKWWSVACVVGCLGLIGCGDPGGGASSPPPEEEPDADGAEDVEQTPDADEETPDAEEPPEVDRPDADEPDTDEPDAEGPVEPVVVPLGETLFFDGDDYLWSWGANHPTPVELVATPEGSQAALVGGGTRLTPDVVGTYTLRRGDEEKRVEVRADTLNEDTFLNFNYTPVTPMALRGQDELWVASPPSNAVQVVRLGTDGAEVGALIPTGAWPTSVTIWEAGGMALVTQAARDSLGFVDLTSARVVDAIRVGDEPAGIVLDEVTEGGPFAYITVSGANEVVRVDLGAREVTGRVAVGRDPRSMAFDAERGKLYVASLVSSNAHPQGLQQVEPLPREAQRDVAVIDVASFEAVDHVLAAGTILRGLWLAPDGRRLVVARTHAANDSAGIDANSRPHHHGLTLVDIEPESPTLHQVVGEVDLDLQPTSSGPAPSPFTMALTPDGQRLMVTLSAGRQVLALNPETFEELERIEAGDDPRGLIFAQGRMWTYAWLDNLIQSWPLDGDGALVEVEVGDDPTPEDVKEGQRIFNDAAFSRHGDFSCNNCHVDGLTDGLVWNILLDGDVNTLAFRNIAGTSPFLWGGILPTLFDFSREVLRLVGAPASGHQMELLTLYMQSVTAPPNPYTLPGGRFTPEAERGRELFFAPVFEGGAGCGDCHSGALFTNQSQVDGKTPEVTTDVPSLIATYDTGPWGRLAQWTTLEEMVTFAAAWTGASALSQEDHAALLAYVQQLPGDVLYLTSATPLKDSRQVWTQTPIELTFSEVLREGQEAHFELLYDDGRDLVPVRGAWVISGRKARFQPIGGPGLGRETRYQILIRPGLESTLGRRMGEPVELDFETGADAELDVSGKWRWDITGLIDGDVTVAALQTTGGHVAGTILAASEAIDFDHVEGFVTGQTLIIEPFLALTPFGEIRVAEIEVLLYDEDNDGLADGGEGEIRSIVNLDVRMVRLEYPQDR